MMKDIAAGMIAGVVLAILFACLVIDINHTPGYNLTKAQVLCPDGVRTFSLMTFASPKVECNDGTNHKVK